MRLGAREVVVVGAGMVGAACARELAARGVDVLLLDRGEVSGGTTGLGEGNVLCSDKDEGPELALTVAGRAVYDQIEARMGARARIRRKGALIVHPDAGTWLGEAGRLERLRAAGVEGALVDAARVRALEPELTGELAGAMHVPGDLQCAPREIARALAEETMAAGGLVRTGVEVAGIAVEDGRVAGVDTVAEGRIAAGAVVLAAGPWSAGLARSAGLPLPLEPRWGQLLQLAAPGGAPARGVSARNPFFRAKVVDGSYLRSVVSPDAGLQVTTVLETTWDGDVLVGSSRARRGFDDTVDPAVGEAMLVRAATLAPRLRELRPVRAWAGLRPWLPDHLPAIGPSEAVPGLWVATGHEGAGVALGPITGVVLAEAYCGETPTVPLAPFSPDRFAAVTG